MRLFSLPLAFFLLLIACRSTNKSSNAMNWEAMEAPLIKTLPVAVGDGFECVNDRRGQGLCFDTPSRGWRVLRAAGSFPGLRNMVARSTVTCGIGMKPPSLENRILCWQPQTETDAVLFSAKINSRLRALSLQKDKVCTLLADGQVACAPLLHGAALKFANVKHLRLIRNVHSGESFTCALRGDTGTIFCWGDNSKGQLGLGSSLAAEDEPVAIAGFYGSAVALEAGSRHACAINDSGEVFCWGDNSDQQLGQGSNELPQSRAPQPIRGLPEKAKALALGEKHSCAQLIDGTVWCWGAAGRLGSDTPGGLIPVKVRLPVRSAMIVASLDKTCSQLTTGEIFCWGTEPEVLAVPR